MVIDYCPRNLVQMSKLLDESHEKLPYGMSHAKNIDLNQIVLFTMLQNHEHKTMEWLLIFPTESERTQWIELVTPPSTSPENPEEKIYEDWDCPLVEAVTSIEAENSNEVPLQKGDKANVLRKLSDSGTCTFFKKCTVHRWCLKVGMAPMTVSIDPIHFEFLILDFLSHHSKILNDVKTCYTK